MARLETNAVTERVIRTLCQESLVHVLVLGERHLERVLSGCVAFSNSARPQRSLGPTPPPLHTARDPRALSESVLARPLLGGLHHVYSRAA